MAGRLLGLLVALILLAVPARAGASVLYIGDSLGVGTVPALESMVGEPIDPDVEVGRPSATGLGLLASELAPEHEIVVFDLGTNDDLGDPEAFAGRLAQAREISGDRCLIVATLNRPDAGGVGIAGMNRAVREFAADNDEVEVVDWQAAYSTPGLLTDGVHSAGDGYGLRARLFADAIEGCSAGGGLPPAVSGGDRGPRRPRAEPAAARTDSPARVERLAADVGRSETVGFEYG